MNQCELDECYSGKYFCENFRDMKQYILLRSVDAGNGRRRLGLSSSDWHEILEMNLNEVVILLPGDDISFEASLNLYRDYGSISNPIINEWLLTENYPLNEQILLFEFQNNEGVHTFMFVGVLSRV